jgi:IMP dehydrogenase family protein
MARRAYGIDEIALVPGNRTLDPSLADTRWRIGGIEREIPIIASAMDGVVDVRMAVLLSQLGAMGVLNLEGIQTRYADPSPVLERIASVGKSEFVTLMQELYAEPIKPELIEQRIREIKEQGGIAAVSATPVGAMKYGEVVASAGADLFFVQATGGFNSSPLTGVGNALKLNSVLPGNADTSDFGELCYLRRRPQLDEGWSLWHSGRHWTGRCLYFSRSFRCGCTSGKCDRGLCSCP